MPPLSPTKATMQVATQKELTYLWSYQGKTIRIAYGISGGVGPAWLLLPALSTISSRQEWQPFAEAIGGRSGVAAPAPRFISVDWPGFGGSERRRLAYDANLLVAFLLDFCRDCCPDNCSLLAAGHGAGIALLAASQGLQAREWVLVAPTWRGPLPTMAGRHSRAFKAIRFLVETPVIGSLLYRLNTGQAVLGWMSRRHVDVAGPGLTTDGLAARQRIARQPGARFASAAFVTGGLDPFGGPDGWLAAASALEGHLTVVIGDQAPPKSLASMTTLSTMASRVAHLPGRLGAHEEFGPELAKLLL